MTDQTEQKQRRPDCRALLAEKRSELLTPVHTIIDTANRVLTDCGSEAPEDFVADLEKVRKLANKLSDVFRDILDPKGDDVSEITDDARRRLRHDILGMLNGILMCSDFWIEDVECEDDLFLAGFVGDFRLVNTAAKRCVQLVDDLLKAWNLDEPAALDAIVADEKVSDGLSVSDWVPNLPNTDEEQIVGHILIIDDDEFSRTALDRHLTVKGHKVSIAADGLQGWERLTAAGASDVDIVLLDIMMPGISGYELLQRMKASPALRNMPVIMISALGEIDAVVKCIKAGADDYLSKPFNLVLLNARIRACLQRRRLEQEMQREKQRADDLLAVILPVDIVAELKESNSVKPRRHEQIAVLFADIVNFTQYCDKHSPQHVLSLLQRLVIEWEQSASRYRVEKIKTIGDAFMAAAGLDGDMKSPVEACIRCGSEMIEATQALGNGWDLRVGIHIGSVVAGVLGKSKYAFDLWGDTVNTASRMESHGEAGAIVLTAEAISNLSGVIPADKLGLICVKGKGNVTAFRIDPRSVNNPQGSNALFTSR